MKGNLQPDDEVPQELCEEIWDQKGDIGPEEKMWTTELQTGAFLAQCNVGITCD